MTLVQFSRDLLKYEQENQLRKRSIPVGREPASSPERLSDNRVKTVEQYSNFGINNF